MSANKYTVNLTVIDESHQEHKITYYGCAFNKQQLVRDIVNNYFGCERISIDEIIQLTKGISRWSKLQTSDIKIKDVYDYVNSEYTAIYEGHKEIMFITWSLLVELEPRLSILLQDILSEEPRKNLYCANWAWVNKFKTRYTKLVGHYCDRDINLLSSSEAYDIGYQYLYDHLPNCRGCMCL